MKLTIVHGEREWGSWVAGGVERVQSKAEESEPDQAGDVGGEGILTTKPFLVSLAYP